MLVGAVRMRFCIVNLVITDLIQENSLQHTLGSFKMVWRAKSLSDRAAVMAVHARVC
jgi:hypothetical protein